MVGGMEAEELLLGLIAAEFLSWYKNLASVDMEKANGSSNPGESSKKCKCVVLPKEMVMEILSWLPLKPLARAQLVCREWRALIQDHKFLEIHINRSPFCKYWLNVTKPNTDTDAATTLCSFSYLHGCDGLLLMKQKNAPQMYFLWNPATRLVLELPSPHIGTYGGALSFVTATKNYKVFSFFKDKTSSTHGCQLLTPGNSMAWRPLPFPDAVNAYSQLNAASSVVPAGGAVHSIVLTIDGVWEIISVDVEAELVTLNRLPTGIFRDTQSARAIDCDGKLGFGVIVGQELQLMVLEDYKNNSWCRIMQVIPLRFLKDKGFEGSKVVILLIKQGEILFWLDDKKLYEYTIDTGKINFVRQLKWLSLSTKLYSYKPSLVTFQGMRRADTELEGRLQPHNLQLE